MQDGDILGEYPKITNIFWGQADIPDIFWG